MWIFHNSFLIRPMQWIIDLARLASCLSLRRMWHLLNVLTGYIVSVLTRRPYVFGGPFALSAEVSANCNLRCPHCIEGLKQTQRSYRTLSAETFKELASSHRHSVFYANLYFQGEPFLNPRLSQIIRTASELRFYSCISTNGHFLEKEKCREIIAGGLDRIVISLDGLDAQTYSFYRVGGNFDKVVEGITTLAATRREMRASNPLIVLQFLVNRQNENQIEGLPSFAKKCGADMVQVKTMQVYGDSLSDDFLPINPRYNRYAKSNTKLKLRSGRWRSCFRLWSHVVYTSDGRLVPCCYDKVPNHSVDLKKGENLWFSPQLNQFRKDVLTNRQGVAICSNCPE